MDYFELIAARESCRSFAPQGVEREKVERMLEAARVAPSACNGQPWRYTAVLKPELVRAVAKCTQGAGMNGFTDQCPAFIVVEGIKSNLSARVGGAVKGQPFAPIDLGLSVMQLCLAATAQGLSTCILGWFDAQKLRDLLDLGRDGQVRLVVCVGYAASGEIREKKRKPLEQLAKFIE